MTTNQTLLLSLALLPALAWAQPGSFTLSGKLGNLTSPAVVELNYRVGERTVRDSSGLTRGHFAFSGRVDGPQFAYMVVYHHGKGSKEMNSDVARLYLEPGHIVMNSPDSLKKAVITGSPLNADQKTLTDALAPNAQNVQAFYRANGYLDAQKSQSPTFVASYNQQLATLTAARKVVQRTFIKAHPASWISLVTLQEYGTAKNGSIPNVADVEPLFRGLAPAVRNSALGRAYQASIEKWKNVAVGQPAPDFTQRDPDGNPVKLSDFRGKYVLLDFWASWCHPCRDENPNLVSQYNRYKDKNFTIVGVSMDGEKQKAAWLHAIQKDGLPWPQLYDEKGDRRNEAVINYGVQSIPENFLIDPAGKIIAHGLRGEALATKLTELFGN